MSENEELQPAEETNEEENKTQTQEPEAAVDAPAEAEAPEEQAAEPPVRDFITISGGKVSTGLDIASMRKDWPGFGVGDTLEVHYKIREGNKERIQVYTGNVISIRGEGLGKSFIVRRVSHEIGVERIFPYHSPMIENIKVVRKAKVRRAKLYYLRHKSGKEGRIKEAVNFAAEEKRAAKKRRKAAAKA